MRLNTIIFYTAIMGMMAFSFAQTSGGFSSVGCAAGCMCGQLMQVLPVVAMLMIIGAGVTYAAGQLMGAETRARANTWATAMLVGAIIGILIVAVAPSMLDIMYKPIASGSAEVGASVCTDPSSVFTGCDCNA